jgi:hypothetical protein
MPLSTRQRFRLSLFVCGLLLPRRGASCQQIGLPSPETRYPSFTITRELLADTARWNHQTEHQVLTLDRRDFSGRSLLPVLPITVRLERSG